MDETPTGDPVGTAPGFDFATSAAATFEIRVTHGGVPLQGASVTFTEPVDAIDDEDSEAGAGAPLFQGGTNSQGLCRGSVRLPARLVDLDVVVHKAGFQGPYTLEPLRSHWGPFAPSSRVRVLRTSHLSLTVALEAQQ